MYPVIPIEMNQFAADSLLYLFDRGQRRVERGVWLAVSEYLKSEIQDLRFDDRWDSRSLNPYP